MSGPPARAGTAGAGAGRRALSQLLILAAGLALAACSRRAPGHQVILIGIDSADWEMILPMADRGELPNIAKLLGEGAWGPATTLEPALSPLLWTSIATGKTPDQHGILDFVTRDPATGRTVPVTSTLRRVEAIWNIASAAGRKVGVVGWLATWPAEEIDGVLVTDRLAFHPFDAAGTGESAERIAWPGSFADTARALMPAPAAIPFDSAAPFLRITREEYDAAPFEAYKPGQGIGNFRRTLAAAEGYRRVSERLLARGDWDLFLAYFEFLDAVSHLFVRHMDPPLRSLPAHEAAAFGEAVPAAYRWQDRVIGELLAKRDPRTFVVLVSDHGFLFGERRLAAGSEVLGGEAALWHRGEGVFLVAGPGVRRGTRLAPVSILDVTPTLLWLLGLPVAEDMAGRPLVGAFDEPFVKANPVRRVPTYETGERNAAALPGEEDGEITERLRALGYMASTDRVQETVNRAILLKERGDFPGSAREWESAKRAAPDRADVAVGLGYALLQLGRPDEARREWERALSLDSTAVDAHLDLGNLAYMEGDLERAARHYDDAIAADTLRAEGWINRAQIDLERGDLDEAARQLQQAKAIAPGNPLARLRLGIALARLGRPKPALEELRRAVELDRGLAAPAGVWIGRALEASGEPSPAEAQYERVIAIDPKNVEARLLLAALLARSGRGERAGGILVDVLKIDPGNAEAKAGLDALSGGGGKSR